ncbi:hypothetical protein AGLY_006314 [Aphis glycines]|uniref:Uncharacterized protein n=1 Tax=Aphis glycines TaxID=307491 RepID=A0A6G0TT14_APHGL|nr:hypothetical protein AGLY_006314 [Aphis glycines]
MHNFHFCLIFIKNLIKNEFYLQTKNQYIIKIKIYIKIMGKILNPKIKNNSDNKINKKIKKVTVEIYRLKIKKLKIDVYVIMLIIRQILVRSKCKALYVVMDIFPFSSQWIRFSSVKRQIAYANLGVPHIACWLCKSKKPHSSPIGHSFHLQMSLVVLITILYIRYFTYTFMIEVVNLTENISPQAGYSSGFS